MDTFNKVKKPELTITREGNNLWMLNGILHREDGPAVVWTNGDKCWFLKGKRHRADGPACEHSSENYWYVNGKPIHCKTNEEFLKLMKLKAFW